MSFSEIRQILHSEIGLHADSVGMSSIDRAISHRMAATNCDKAGKYIALLKNNSSELEELIEEVVVPETWFFRNKVPFELLRENGVKLYSDLLKEKTSKQNNKEPVEEKFRLQALSVPCSSGEEPYSIAIALSESGLDADDFHVDAVDISKRALRKAKGGIFGKHSFREDGISFHQKYFKKTKSGYQLRSTIRDRVEFKQANILSDDFCPPFALYDIIFCRNLLIYFDRDTQSCILEKLSGILKPGGILFVGHAEASQIDRAVFSKVRFAKAFAFRKKNRHNKAAPFLSDDNDQSVNKLKDIYNQLVEVTKKDIEIARKISRPKKPPIKVRSRRVSKPEENGEQFSFKEVSMLIERGRFDEAIKACEELLIVYPENANAYYYLGLISSLQGSHGGAESLLRKALYLSPNHHQALALSAVLAEKRGDTPAADALRRREKKARERNSK